MSHRTGVSTFASPTSPSTNQSLQKSFHLSSPDKFELKKISFPSKNKKYATTQPNDIQKSVAIQTPKPLTGTRFNYSVDRRPACNMRLASCGVKCLISSSVFQINFSAGLTVLCSEIPHERQAQKRYRSFS